MSSTDYSRYINNSRKLLPCQKNKVFLSDVYDPRHSVAEKREATTYDILLLDTSPVQISRNRFQVDFISDFDMVLYEGTKFMFANRIYYLAEQITLVANTPLLAVKMQTIETTLPTNGTVGNLKHIYPYFGVNSINQVEENQAIEDNVFSGGFGMEKALVGVSDGYELSGPRAVNDTGYDLLYECKTTGKAIDVQFVTPFIEIDEFSALVISMDRTVERSNFCQIKCLIAKLL